MSDHSKPTQYDPGSPGGLNSRLIMVLFLISAALLIVILASVEAWFYNQERKLAESDYRRGNPPLQAIIDAQEKRLTGVHRIEGDETHVAVPLEVAVEVFLAEHEK